MTHRCMKCGAELDEGAKYCPNCGTRQDRNPTTAAGKDSPLAGHEETLLQIVLRLSARHRAASVAFFVVLTAAVGACYGYRQYEEKQAVQEKMESEVQHLIDISGTYHADNGTELRLRTDGTAQILTPKYQRYKGYWREKMEGGPIEINFSDHFEIRVGDEDHYYCTSLYFYHNALWYTLDAIRSNDFSKCTSLTKE